MHMTEKTSSIVEIDWDAVYHHKTISWRKEEDNSITIRWGGMYHVLNSTAAYMWQLLSDKQPAREIVTRFVDHYKDMEADLEYLRDCAEDSLKDMLKKSLIAKHDAVWDDSWDDI